MADAARDVGTLLAYKAYNGDGVQDTFALTVDLHRYSTLRVQVKNPTTLVWDIQVEGTDYVRDYTNIVFQAGSIPAVGTGNIEVWRETTRLNHSEALPNISINLPPSLVKVARQSNIGQVSTVTLTTALATMQELEDQQVDDSVGLSIMAWAAAQTAAAVRHDGVSTITSHIGVEEPSLLFRVDATILHNDASPATDWLLKLFVVDTPGATPKEMGRHAIDFSSATALQNEDYSGNWKDPSSGNDVQIAVDPGQQWYLSFTGSSHDYILGQVRVGRRRRSPYTNS